MKTAQAGVKRALRFWLELPAEQQQELLTKCQQGSVIQYDTKSQAWSVVSVFFGMDLCIDSPRLYLFPDDIQ
jgi:hypothetical protein